MKYRLSNADIATIEREFKDPEQQKRMKEVFLQDKIEWIEDRMPSTPQRTADGRDIGLEEIRRELEKEIGIEVVEE